MGENVYCMVKMFKFALMFNGDGKITLSWTFMGIHTFFTNDYGKVHRYIQCIEDYEIIHEYTKIYGKTGTIYSKIYTTDIINDCYHKFVVWKKLTFYGQLS